MIKKRLNPNLASFFVGLLFALGLGISGMTQPEKVIGFLNVLGNWDPTLLFVMLGAIPTHTLLYRKIKKRSTPLLSADWHIPTRKEITPKLIVGSAFFGIGWGLAGMCPGPAFVSLAGFSSTTFLVLTSMYLGWWLYYQYERKTLS